MATQVWAVEDQPVTLFAREKDWSDAYITQSSITTITYKVWDLDAAEDAAPVNDAGALVVASVVFNSLQTGDSRWTLDSIGYNFRATLPKTDFPTGGHTYRVEIKFDPATGDDFYENFEVTVGSIRHS